VADTLVKASSTFASDQIRAYERAIARETNENAKWVLEKLIENSQIAEERSAPLCDDTGTPHVIIELGENAILPGYFLNAVEQGVAEGLRRLPARAMGVLGNEKERISQELGLGGESSVLATFVKIGMQRASGWRVVSLRTECCVGPRKAFCEF